MKKIILTILLFLMSNVTFAKNNFTGLWQFKDRAVWVKILANNQAYQCRIATNGVPIVSKGTLTNNKIIWEQHWGVDVLTLNAGILYLEGRYGKFGFNRHTSKMIRKCNSPI